MIKEVQEYMSTKNFSKLKEYLEVLNSADIPLLFDNLDEEQIIIVYFSP